MAHNAEAQCTSSSCDDINCRRPITATIASIYWKMTVLPCVTSCVSWKMTVLPCTTSYQFYLCFMYVQNCMAQEV